MKYLLILSSFRTMSQCDLTLFERCGHDESADLWAAAPDAVPSGGGGRGSGALSGCHWSRHLKNSVLTPAVPLVGPQSGAGCLQRGPLWEILPRVSPPPSVSCWPKVRIERNCWGFIMCGCCQGTNSEGLRFLLLMLLVEILAKRLPSKDFLV